MAHVPRARLGDYREQAGAISFRITSSPDSSATIGALKARVPAWARQYNARTREWRIKTEFRDVLEDLFLNVPSLYAGGGSRGGYDEAGPRSQWLWMALAAVILITAGALYWARQPTGVSPIPPVAAVQAQAAVAQAPAFTPQPGRVTSVVNLRSGPGTDFPVQNKLSAGAAVVAVAKAQASDGYWWLRLETGAWVRSDLVVSTAAGELPLDLGALPVADAANAATDALPSGGADANHGRVQATVTWVSDGDTAHVLIDGREHRVRYIGITAPDRTQPNYQQAVDANSALVAGKQVWLVRDVTEADANGRLLRYVYLADGTFVNEALLRDGWAAALIVAPDVAQQQTLLAAESEARSAKRGIWSDQ